MHKVSVEFLEENQFKQKEFPEGVYWLKYYKVDSYLQASPCRTIFTEDDNGHIEHLTMQEFVDTVIANQKAIDQE